jgi:DNA-binding GntR family transcriptional regulator
MWERHLAPPSSAPELVREQLREAIISGELVSGAKLSQDELAARFGTSRIPVREALRQLEAEGLVTLYPNRGAVVATLSLADVLEIMEIRIALECRALQLAIPNMIDSDLDGAEEILKRYDAEPEPASWSEMNWRFHEALYSPCNLSRLLALIEANFGHVSRFMRVQISRAVGREGPQRDHHNILNACREADVEKAVKLLEKHLLGTQKALMAMGRRSKGVGNLVVT